MTTSVDTSTGTGRTLRSVARRRHPGRLDHDDRGPPDRPRAMHDAAGDGVALMGIERHGLAVFEVDEQPAVEDEEELVGLVVLVPVEVAVEHADADHALVDRRER